jgi:hypothetical protein
MGKDIDKKRRRQEEMVFFFIYLHMYVCISR